MLRAGGRAIGVVQACARRLVQLSQSVSTSRAFGASEFLPRRRRGALQARVLHRGHGVQAHHQVFRNIPAATEKIEIVYNTLEIKTNKLFSISLV